MKRHPLLRCLPLRLPLRLPLCLLVCMLAGTSALAQQIWRCGADGRSFSDRPCPQGEAIALASGPSRAEMAAARVVAQRDQALAEQLKAERITRSEQLQGNGLMAIGPLQADRDARRAAQAREARQLPSKQGSDLKRQRGRQPSPLPPAQNRQGQQLGQYPSASDTSPAVVRGSRRTRD